MERTVSLQHSEDFALLRCHQQRNGGGQLLFLRILLFDRIGIVSAACGDSDDLHILQFRRNHRHTLFFVIRSDDRHNIAGNQLAGKPCGKGFDRYGDGLLFSGQMIEVGVFCGGSIGDFGADDVIPRHQIGGSKFADHRIRMPDHILR